MMEANPEMAHMMNDPEMIRQAMRMAANPVQPADALPGHTAARVLLLNRTAETVSIR
jgi:hypothetical protein